MACLALVGLKPMAEAYKEFNNLPRRRGQWMTHALTFMLSRGLEIVTESIPQGVFQASVLLTAEPEDRSVIQALSLVFSVLSVAYLAADIDFYLDGIGRRDDPQYHGYFPASGGAKVATKMGVLVFVLGFAVARVLVLGALLGASGTAAAAWLVTESLVWLAVRAAHTDWRCGIKGLGGRGLRVKNYATLAVRYVIYVIYVNYVKPTLLGDSPSKTGRSPQKRRFYRAKSKIT